MFLFSLLRTIRGKNWRNILKGIYDTNKEKMTLLVIGSARLGWYRKSGDSLVGRYFSYQMLPLGLPEAANNYSYILMNDEPLRTTNKLTDCLRKIKPENAEEKLGALLSFSGFPEPFVKNSMLFYNRWNAEYKSLLTKEDKGDLSDFHSASLA